MFFIKLVTVHLISLTIMILVKFLMALITIIIMMIIITTVKIMTVITKIVKFFLIINLHPPKITMVKILQFQIKLMILILLLEVRNLKNIIVYNNIYITVTTTNIIVKVIIMKTTATIKGVLVIKLIAPFRHQPRKKTLFILGYSIVKKNKRLLTNTKTDP